MKLHISPNNKKVPFPNISHTPVEGCGNCDSCADRCYAMKAYRMYPNVRTAWDENLALWDTDPAAYRAQLTDFLARTRQKMFRYFVAGDVPDQSYVEMMMELAGEFPHIKFLVFTKMHHLDFHAFRRPENIEIVFSMFPTMDTPYDQECQFAWCQVGTENRIPDDAIWCPGHCGNCGMCWNLSKLHRDVYFDIH